MLFRSEIVGAALKRINDGMCLLAKAYMDLGCDGVYLASLGGERHFFTDEQFETFIKPLDRAILQTVKDAGGYTFLHICKDNLNMARYTDYVPLSDFINGGVHETNFSIEEARALFGEEVALMGGLANRSGVLVDGTLEELTETVKNLVGQYGKSHYILGADCTLPTEIDYNRILTAVRGTAI